MEDRIKLLENSIHVNSTHIHAVEQSSKKASSFIAQRVNALEDHETISVNKQAPVVARSSKPTKHDVASSTEITKLVDTRIRSEKNRVPNQLISKPITITLDTAGFNINTTNSAASTINSHPASAGNNNVNQAGRNGSSERIPDQPKIPNTDKITSDNRNSNVAPTGRIKCLLIHDYCHSKFDSDRFDNRYDIITYNIGSIENALKADNRKLRDFIAKHNPECIYIHLGLEDLSQGSSVNLVTLMSNELLRMLLDISNVKICVSEIIPCVGNNVLNRKIHEVNRVMYNTISDMRKSHVDRICCFNNNRVIGHLRWKYGCEQKYEISDRGKGILWLRLKYGLTKVANLGSYEGSPNKPRNNVTHLYNMNNKSHG